MSSALILIGRVAGAFGVAGEVRITAYATDPLSLLTYAPLTDANGEPVLALASGRAAKGALIAKTHPPITREAAQALRGLELYVARAALPPAGEDEFYLADLIGLAVRSPAGEPLGRIKWIQDFGAGDLLEIDPADGSPTWWAPFTAAVVPEVRLGEGVVIVDRPAETSDEPSR